MVGRARPARRRRSAAAVVAAAAVALPLLTTATAAPAAAHPALPSSVFDPASVDWASVRMGSAQFAGYHAQKVAEGFMVTDLEVDVIDGRYQVGAVFQRNTDGRTWRSLRDLTSAQFSAAWADAEQAGMRLVDQETYVLSGQRRYAGVWVENRERYAWASYRDVTGAQFAERFATYRNRRMMPVDIEGYRVGSEVRFAAAWVHNAEGLAWEQHRGLTSTQFSQTFGRLASTHRMLDLEAYDTPQGQRWAGIWVENRNRRGWIALRGLTERDYENRWNRYLDEGYRVVDYERYSTPSGPRYAAVWRQNSPRPSFPLKSRIDARVQRELDAHRVPGISVAVMRDGEVLYERGFGHADVSSDVWMDARHVQRLASISKAVAGALTFRMVERGEVALTDRTRTLVPQAPAHHTHTVGQLLSNRGCVRHYDSTRDQFTSQHYDTALAAFRRFWNDPLVCRPGDYVYSTQAQTALAAALEAAASDGRSVSQLLESRLRQPFRLGTLRAEDLGVPARRTTLYRRTSSGANVVTGRDDLSWKVLGGGLEASAADLAGFADSLVRGRILSAGSLATMWTPPDGRSRYAYGWSTGTEAGRRVVAKDGAQNGAQSYLRVYPDDRLVVAVLTNRRNGGHSAPQLGRDLGAMLVDWVDDGRPAA